MHAEWTWNQLPCSLWTQKEDVLSCTLKWYRKSNKFCIFSPQEQRNKALKFNGYRSLLLFSQFKRNVVLSFTWGKNTTMNRWHCNIYFLNMKTEWWIYLCNCQSLQHVWVSSSGLPSQSAYGRMASAGSCQYLDWSCVSTGEMSPIHGGKNNWGKRKN